MTDKGSESVREGSTKAPERHPVDWKNPSFYDEGLLLKELERVFDICHGCRRCFSLCHAFPTLFDAIDDSDSGEIDGIGHAVYWEVVDHCYLCDLCFMTKCPYVPPHDFNIDFPHLMLRAKAVKHRQGRDKTRDKILTSTDAVGRLASIPVVAETVNAVNRNGVMRKVLESTLGVHREALLPPYHSRTLRKRVSNEERSGSTVGDTKGRVILFTTCYGNYNEPHVGEDLVAVFRHNGIAVRLPDAERCCGMPKLELGDLEAVQKAKEANIPELVKWVDAGWDIVAPVPSCVLMFKQELPLLFPDDPDVAKVKRAIYDPFEYLYLRHKGGAFNTEFKSKLGKVAYHVPCHLRVQNIGLKTRDVLQLVPEIEIDVIERCSGHDGTYAVKKEYHDIAMKIGRPVANKVRDGKASYYASDCPMAGHHIENGLRDGSEPVHPMSLLRKAYGI